MKKSVRIAGWVAVLILAVAVGSAAALNLPAAPAPVASAPAAQAATSSPDPAPRAEPRVTAVSETPVSEAPAPDYSGAIALVTANRAFGEALYDDGALLDAVEITLLDRAVEIDGFRYLERALVQEVILARYGRSVSPEAGEVYGMDPPEGYYALLPRSYDYHEQTVTSVREQEDGRLLVTSALTVEGLDTRQAHTVETLLAPAENEYGYVIVSADIVE